MGFPNNPRIFSYFQLLLLFVAEFLLDLPGRFDVEKMLWIVENGGGYWICTNINLMVEASCLVFMALTLPLLILLPS